MFSPSPRNALVIRSHSRVWHPPPMAMPEETGTRDSIRLAPRVLLAWTGHSELSSLACYLPSEWQVPVISSQAEQLQVLVLLVWGWLVWGISQLWLLIEDKKLAAWASSISRHLSELSRCCYKTQDLVLVESALHSSHAVRKVHYNGKRAQAKRIPGQLMDQELILLTRSHVSFVSTLRKHKGFLYFSPTVCQEPTLLLPERGWKFPQCTTGIGSERLVLNAFFAMIQSLCFGMLWLCLILRSYYMLIDLTLFH